ncbi:MAG: hypothetical protein K940chlam9_01107 [Chlamydiae bacterium]|nr:hypothetical protein [Chlamydiota bacterium]
MKKIFFILFLVFAMGIPLIHAAESSNDISLEEIVLTVSLDQLIISSEGIMVNYEGNLLPVHSVIKKGEEWVVKATGGWYKCPRGHTRACPLCGGCAFLGCPFYCDGYCCSYKNETARYGGS